ncbi:MAG: phosphocholine cytidylyltransferase family protein [Verrucomicrobiales bacterium]|nr:phosphocholine cytidylyltransferase family protein [Verrucomicrobiales bacterium]
MTAIIYAAGRATRLGPAYAQRPKIMIEFGGLSLLERHVICLADVGIQRVVVVTGHCREAIASELPRIAREHRVEVVECFNPDFGEGSVISLAVSFPEIEASKDGVLLMDGDVLYDSRLLRNLLASKHPSALLVDFHYSTADDDPVLVPITRERPFEFLKRWRGTADKMGESVGFFKVAPQDLALLAEETRARSVGRRRLDSMDEVLRALVKADRFGYEDISGMPWTEIDFPTDISYAREHILPSLNDLRHGILPRPR